MGGLLDEFFKKKFLQLLGKKKRSQNQPTNTASQRLAQLGFTIEPALARLLDFVETHYVPEIGPLRFFEIDDVVADGKNSLEFLLVQPFRVDAALLHAFPLGATGSGDLWFVSLDAHQGKHEVFRSSPVAATNSVTPKAPSAPEGKPSSSTPKTPTLCTTSP